MVNPSELTESYQEKAQRLLRETTDLMDRKSCSFQLLNKDLTIYDQILSILQSLHCPAHEIDIYISRKAYENEFTKENDEEGLRNLQYLIRRYDKFSNEQLLRIQFTAQEKHQALERLREEVRAEMYLYNLTKQRDEKSGEKQIEISLNYFQSACLLEGIGYCVTEGFHIQEGIQYSREILLEKMLVLNEMIQSHMKESNKSIDFLSLLYATELHLAEKLKKRSNVL